MHAMKRWGWFLLCGVLCIGFSSGQSQDPVPAENEKESKKVGEILITNPLPSGTSMPIGGEALGAVKKVGDVDWHCGHCRITTPLPVGYPTPTAPGAVELKSYPLVRRAKVEGKIMPDLASNFGFWKLFSHIKSREIAMTSPVEMEYSIDIESADPKVAGWAMSFLYRSTDLGPTGVAGAVVVEDEAAQMVLSIGIQGGYGVRQVLGRVEELSSWLDRLPGWEIAGDPRALFYNGPEMPSSRRWGEVQLPLRRKKHDAADPQ